MRKRSLTLLLMPLWFATLTHADSASYWQCTSYDNENKQWLAKSTYQRAAINQAYDNCKKQSKKPESCKTAKEYCEAYVDGILSRPMWQCVALDNLPNRWQGSIYTNRDEAIFGAKSWCQEQSVMPETCYVNLLMCSSLMATD